MNKTITKTFAFVISLILTALVWAGCSSVSSSTEQENVNKPNGRLSDDYGPPQIVGKIDSREINESSGLAASRCNQGVFWTHNDSGDKAFIYALDEKGRKLGTWRVAGAENEDWEDIAAFRDGRGECFLYIADSGNNTRARDIFTVYRVKEPFVSDADKKSSQKSPLLTEPAETIKYKYPDFSRNAETLLVQPKTGDIYILTKRLGDPSGVYKISAVYSSAKTNTLKKIADFTVPAVPNGFLTGGDISADGQRVVLCDYFSAYEIKLPEKAQDFDEIWKQKALIVELGEREQGEAVGYTVDGQAIFATSEKKNSPFIEVRRK